MRHIVSVGDMKTGRDSDMFVTYALGSCLGLVVYDPEAMVGGMLHAMLPLSKLNPEKAGINPYMFVDTGVPALFHELYRLGGKKERMVVKAAGCAQPLGDNGAFRIGERNYAVLKKILWKSNCLLAAEDVGDVVSRTLFLDLSKGRTTIKKKGVEEEL